MASASSESVAALRAALAARCGDDSPPGPWRAAAAAAGVSGADAFVCKLSSSIVAALEDLAVSAEVARSQLVAVSVRVEDNMKPYVDELVTRIATIEMSKRVALELELCAVDATLERLQDARGTVADAVASLSDAELEERHSVLAAGLDAADAQLLALPTSVVEPPYVGLVIDRPKLLAGIAAFGRVVSPRAIAPADLVPDRVPRHTWPSNTLQLRLSVRGALHMSASAEELEISLGSAVAAMHVDVTLESEGAATQPLPVGVVIDWGKVVISISVPGTAAVGSSVCFGPLTVSGQSVAGLPRTLRVQVGGLRLGRSENPSSALLQSLIQPAHPVDLTPEYAAQLQAWLPRGGSTSPCEWEEVYRATTHGFGAGDFHTHCDGHARLLVLVRTREGGWLFGGFTAVGFSRRPTRDGYGHIDDPAVFLYSLTNSLGHPERLKSRLPRGNLYYSPCLSARFGTSDLVIFGDADKYARSYTHAGPMIFEESASMGMHPLAKGTQKGWHTAEVVAWVV